MQILYLSRTLSRSLRLLDCWRLYLCYIEHSVKNEGSEGVPLEKFWEADFNRVRGVVLTSRASRKYRA